MVEKLFRFLFKYPPLMFQQGDFTWGLSRPVLLVVTAAAALAVLALLTYRGVSATDRPRVHIHHLKPLRQGFNALERHRAHGFAA